MIPYDERRRTVERAEMVASEAGRLGASTALDLGAGTGIVAQRLASDGLAVTAVDPNLNGAKGITVVRRLFTIDDLRSVKVDLVVALSVLHHMPDWSEAFKALRAAARRAVIVEVPHTAEQLRKAPARGELGLLYETVEQAAVRCLGTAPSVYDPALERQLFVIPPIVEGAVFGGSGSHTRTQERYGEAFEERLGYRPYPGSLNLALEGPPDLGPPQDEIRPVEPRCYQVWRARIGDQPCHLMIPDRAHPNSVEVLAPTRLRDQLDLSDGDLLEVEVLW